VIIKKKNTIKIDDAPEHFILIGKNGNRIPKKWEVDLQNLLPEAKASLKKKIKEYNDGLLSVMIGV
jgi:hypothetical protein